MGTDYQVVTYPGNVKPCRHLMNGVDLLANISVGEQYIYIDEERIPGYFAK